MAAARQHTERMLVREAVRASWLTRAAEVLSMRICLLLEARCFWRLGCDCGLSHGASVWTEGFAVLLAQSPLLPGLELLADSPALRPLALQMEAQCARP